MRAAICSFLLTVLLSGCGGQNITFQTLEEMPWGTIGKPENWRVSGKSGQNIVLESLEEHYLKVDVRVIPTPADKDTFAMEQAKQTGRKLEKQYETTIAGVTRKIYETSSTVGKKTLIEKMFFIDNGGESLAVVWAYPDGSKQSWQPEGIADSVIVRGR